ncbi:MAG TPA: hypothetical protein DEB09_05275 [Candidatus Magasanikbacteria bacterium]|nr:hypothetical protein [Candidatus Magasanikbacteria bacterium]
MPHKHNPAYTHFRGNKISRVELIERMVVETILKSKMPNEKRSWGKIFEIKHSSSVIQIGRILAQKRGLDEEISAIVCALHDIHVNHNGDAKNHAQVGATLAEKILKKTKKFTAKEIKIIMNAVKEHSNKHLVSKDPYVELVKDADAFDCTLYVNTHDAYVYEKSPEVCRTYFDRVIRIRKELGLPHDKQWDTIDYINK